MISIPIRLRKYKEQVEPKEYYPDLLTDYLFNKYTCKDITCTFQNEFAYKVIMDNLKEHFGDVDQLTPVVFRIVKNKNSKQLYRDFNEYSKGFIYVLLDKKSGFFDSNSNGLIYELTIEKSVSKEDYENETVNLLAILGMIETETIGISEENISSWEFGIHRDK